ncbi:MAG TPA: hypothetical protein VK762_25215 [Polyangiaceae bacterium]|nr:hypothetical protein [Polyangiaceae bacterium]
MDRHLTFALGLTVAVSLARAAARRATTCSGSGPGSSGWTCFN